jgi:hypothetical protein
LVERTEYESETQQTWGTLSGGHFGGEFAATSRTLSRT